MKKRIVILCICICTMTMIACSSKETNVEVAENGEVSEEVAGEESATLIEVEAEEAVEFTEESEEIGPDFYLYGKKYNVADKSEEEERVLGIYTPEGFRVDVRSKRASATANMAENDVSAVDFKGFTNGEYKNVKIETGIADGTMLTSKRCVKLFLGTGEYEDYLVENAGSFYVQQEIVPTFMEKKNTVQTAYGNAQIIYMIGNGADMHREGADVEQAFEFVLLNIDGCDIYLKCAYGEVVDYKGILETVLPQMMPELMQEVIEGKNIIFYGEYDFVIAPYDLYGDGFFGCVVPEGYIISENSTSHINGDGLDLSGEKENIYVRFMSEKSYPELINFLSTGTFEEGDNEYYKVIAMEDCGTMETIYGTARIVYQKNLWSYGGEDAIEYVVFNVNGYDVVIGCYYEEPGEYREALKEIVPIIIGKKIQ